jgi:hypothetical protein
MELERLRMEKEAEAAAAEHALAVERERLSRQLVASNAEQRLAEDVRRLEREMELVRARFEEVSRSLVVCVYVRARACVCVCVCVCVTVAPLAKQKEMKKMLYKYIRYARLSGKRDA